MLEEIAAAWMSVGVGISVYVMACHALGQYGAEDQVTALLPDMISGRQLGAWSAICARQGDPDLRSTNQIQKLVIARQVRTRYGTGR